MNKGGYGCLVRWTTAAVIILLITGPMTALALEPYIDVQNDPATVIQPFPPTSMYWPNTVPLPAEPWRMTTPYVSPIISPPVWQQQGAWGYVPISSWNGGMTVSECLRRVQYGSWYPFETMTKQEAVPECVRGGGSSGSGRPFETFVTTGSMNRQLVYYVPRG